MIFAEYASPTPGRAFNSAAEAVTTRAAKAGPHGLARDFDRLADLVQVDCAACHHVALLTPDFLLRLGLSPQAKVLDLKARVRCRGCRAKGASCCLGEVGASGRLSSAVPPAGSERDETRARWCASALRAATTTRPRPTSPQPPS